MIGRRIKRVAWAAGLAVLALGCGAPTYAQAPALAFSASGNDAFDTWRADFARRAIVAGHKPGVVKSLLDGLTPDPRIIDQDLNQAEFVRPVWEYIQRAVTPSRIATGSQKRAEAGLAFSQVQAKYGVDADIIAGIWAMETNFGAAALSYDAPRAIATLAYDQRRRAQFEGYLMALIEMDERGYAGPAEMKSSWAGAMGQPQFMPDVYLSAAVDWDGDGKRDIWNNDGDIIASIANYLSIKGWRPNEPTFEETSLPQGFDFALADGNFRPVSDWAALGVKRIDGSPWDAKEGAMSAQLYLPAGAQGPVLLLFPNFSVIKKYNNSDRYALCVALLARGFEGKGGLSRPWPTEVGSLQRPELVELQSLLMRIGYYTGAPDGMFGSGTRRAVGLFQKANGYAPDGYPTPDLLVVVRKVAGAPAAPAKTADHDLTPLKKAQIVQLQKALSRLGYKVGRANGVVNGPTRKAIQAEERRAGATPTGKATAFVLAQAKARLKDKDG